MKRAGRTRIGTLGSRRASAAAAQGIGALDARDALGVIPATEELLCDAGDTGQAEQAELLRVTLLVELGKLGEMAAKNQLKRTCAPLGIWLVRAREKGRWRCLRHA
jgi:hypothetical protein